ncbi:protein gp37 [Pseudonocardia sediminis]|uniref:Protein gp37 n=1 Tax=Pseudonocardia sediminis TaxID=1397368 RepID=A0A4Q7V0C1_PSEST|nr:phage Gp37/Gp68 family protein [Pseudonocardia sediminis]RZT87525.1 protein gp37 [Pseudonocardia sediminis]
MTTSIEWTEATWNPTTGCDRVSPGCDNCYAMTMAKRLKGMGKAKYQNDGDPKTSGPGFGITEHPSALNLPMRWRKPRKVFVNSMSDLFHAGVSDEFIARVFATMALASQHTYQILTKRHARMRSLLSSPAFEESVRLKVRHYDATEVHHREVANWPLPNVWLGVSVEDQKRADLRVPALLNTPAAVRFLSCEPLLGSVDLAATMRRVEPGEEHPWTGDRLRVADVLHWVIVGGESGPGHRPMHTAWARQLRDQCVAAEVPFLFKQWGGATPKADGRELDGRTWDEYPTVSS